MTAVFTPLWYLKAFDPGREGSILENIKYICIFYDMRHSAWNS